MPASSSSCMNTEETVMEGHMHEHGPLYICVPFLMFYDGGWVVACIVVLCCVVVSSEWTRHDTHHTARHNTQHNTTQNTTRRSQIHRKISDER